MRSVRIMGLSIFHETASRLELQGVPQALDNRSDHWVVQQVLTDLRNSRVIRDHQLPGVCGSP